VCASRRVLVSCLVLSACKAQPKTNAARPASAPRLEPSDAGAAAADDTDARAERERAARVDLARAAFDAGTWEGGELYAASVRTS